MRAWTLGSGSRGNAILVECGSTRVLVDAGFPPRTLRRRMSAIGVAPESVSALVVTHEHIDHSRGVVAAHRKWHWPVYGSEGTLASIRGLAPEHRMTLRRGRPTAVGDMLIELVPVSHDAREPTAVLATHPSSGFRTGIAHDLGVSNAGLEQAFAHIDLLLVESNHDEGMLRAGPYPRFLQDRIAGGSGHLSNRQCAGLISALATPALRHLVLLHLSEANNVPRIAEQSATRALRSRGGTCAVEASPQDRPAGPFGTPRPPRQLSLAL